MKQNSEPARETDAPRPSSLADMVAAPQAVSLGANFTRASLLKAGLVALALVAINYRQFPIMALGWTDPNWSHGYMIPLFSLYLLYVRRHELLRAKRQVCPWALPAVVICCVLQVIGYRIHNPWSCQVSMALLAVALVAFLGGMKLTRLVWLPILFMVFAMRIPPMYYQKVAYPLQVLGARGAGAIMNLFGVRVDVVESRMDVLSQTQQVYPLVVEEVCSGMRLLMAFSALGVAMAYLEDRPVWQRVVLVVLGVPVAVACNIIRVALTCLMYYLDKPELGKDFMHTLAGIVMLIPAFGILWFVGWLMHGLFEDNDEGSGGDSKTGPRQEIAP